MSCPTLAELPIPPTGKVGWPWTQEPNRLPARMPDGREWPRISVVTPSYNQGQYLEETIRSVLLQGYPNLEYFVMDGGSSDDSPLIIHKYRAWLTRWVSEKDGGQSNAIATALSWSTGSIFNWINSDDYLTPLALVRVALGIGDAACASGGVIDFVGGGDEVLRSPSGITPLSLQHWDDGIMWHQPGTWLRPELVRECGGINEDLLYVFDRDLMLRYLSLYPDVIYIPFVLARFRIHPQSHTFHQMEWFEREEGPLRERINTLDRLRLLRDLEVERYGPVETDWEKASGGASQAAAEARDEDTHPEVAPRSAVSRLARLPSRWKRPR